MRTEQDKEADLTTVSDLMMTPQDSILSLELTDALYKRTYPLMVRKVRNIVGKEHTCCSPEDVAMERFLGCTNGTWRQGKTRSDPYAESSIPVHASRLKPDGRKPHLARYTGELGIESWMMREAESAARDALRRCKCREATQIPDGGPVQAFDPAEVLGGHIKTVELLLAVLERIDTWLKLAQFPEGERLAYVARLKTGSIEGAATLLGKSENHISVESYECRIKMFPYFLHDRARRYDRVLDPYELETTLTDLENIGLPPYHSDEVRARWRALFKACSAGMSKTELAEHLSLEKKAVFPMLKEMGKWIKANTRRFRVKILV